MVHITKIENEFVDTWEKTFMQYNTGTCIAKTHSIPRKSLLCTGIVFNLTSTEDISENYGEFHHCKNWKFEIIDESQLKI